MTDTSTLKHRSTKGVGMNHLPEQHAPGVLDVLLDLDQESDGLTTIQETVVICESEVHHLRDDS